MYDSVVMLWGEMRCWSLFGVKRSSQIMVSDWPYALYSMNLTRICTNIYKNIAIIAQINELKSSSCARSSHYFHMYKNSLINLSVGGWLWIFTILLCRSVKCLPLAADTEVLLFNWLKRVDQNLLKGLFAGIGKHFDEVCSNPQFAGKDWHRKVKKQIGERRGVDQCYWQSIFFFSYFGVIIFFEDCNTDMQLLWFYFLNQRFFIWQLLQVHLKE